jgi:hypothetical protein
MKSQCLYYALDKWQEIGGYILFRKSIHWCIPHVLHLDNKTNKITHFVPLSNMKYPWYSLFGFEGYVKEGDSGTCLQMNPVCIILGVIILLFLSMTWYFKRLINRKNDK